MKALILAAGSRSRSEHAPWVLETLGDRPIIEYVVDLALQAVTSDDLIIVIGKEDAAIREHLGDAYQYVVQDEQLGTGHAILQAQPCLEGYTGSLLILYGDTPLFRRSSILGLINRHRQKQAGLSLLTATLASDLPYDRILRGQDGSIADLAGAGDDGGAEQLAELNIGAYMVESSELWPALHQAIRANPEDDIPFTTCIRQLLHERCSVASYQVLDDDEALGINTPDDLEQAGLILKKRQLRPRRIEEHNIIRFGTGGWRALIGEGFTLHNVRRLCQALANDIVRKNREADGVLIGYDRRFLGDVAARAAAEVFAGNNIAVQLLKEDAPTPLITYATAEKNLAYGLVFTASHNPPQWNGLKVFASDGSLPLDEQTRQFENEANALDSADVVKVELEIALQSGMVRWADYTNAYVDAVEALIDMQAIRNAGLSVLLDPMFGVGQVTLQTILTEARCRVTTIHERHDPLFGGRSPAPDPRALTTLMSLVSGGPYDLGLAMDGDADRIAIVDSHGVHIPTNELLLLLYYYLHQVRGQRGGLTRNVATTHLLDRLAAHFGETSYETPVGFKHLAASMKAHDVLLAGESSGGLSIRGHILGKDGIFACALVVEMLARTGRSIADMLSDIYAITGRLVSREVNLPATPDMKVHVPRNLAATSPTEVAGYPVQRVSHLDGTKFYLENDNWLLLRFSGTEPLLRIFAEADTEEKVDELLAWAQDIIQI
ncbi:MAG: NTP transferase domain-containing protein [Chloroflexota bacterium]|nr:NTP transferase domain-containing protein [Chloroflexota bacterium]